ncbi:MAG TPA: TonB-dependent receptor plug domain-containing protein [Balneolaceae bacterium]|nr:TonB-dependent receptor plug domain-containing protein [Balneolaceae bacterium]
MKYALMNFVIALSLVGCASSGKVSGSKNNNKARSSDITVTNPTVSLSDYLRRVPGILIFGSGSGTQVMVRGASTINGENSPLFVVDGSMYGRNFSSVQNLVPVNSIRSIRVLKGVEASSNYGLQGSAGVIVISTKGS